MSLINDALKKVNARFRKQPNASSEPSINPSPFPPSDKKEGLIAKMGKGIIVCVILVAMWVGKVYIREFIHSKFYTRTDAKAAAATNTPAVAAFKTNNNPIARSKAVFDKVHDLENSGDSTMITPKKLVETAENASATPAKDQVAQAAPPAAPAPSKESPSQAVAEKIAKSSTFPSLKLQGIFFKTINPAAMVNGKMVNIGTEIEGAKVVSIDRQSVIMEMQGQTNLLIIR